MTRIWALAGLLALPLAASAQDELSATIEKIERKVEVQRGGGAWEPATVKMQLAAGDKVHTGFKATATVRFGDGSVIDVKPMSMVMLQKLEDPDGKVKNRVWMRIGEVGAKVERPTGAPADFEVRTTTVTASVRGTRIQRIACNAGIGTRISMGSSGRIEAKSRGGRAHLSKNERSQAKDPMKPPLTPQDVDRRELVADVQPTGSVGEELEDVEDTGVPKTNPLNTGGSGLASQAVLATQALNSNVTPVFLPGSPGTPGSVTSPSITRVNVPIPALP
jgi:hypothetical protein